MPKGATIGLVNFGVDYFSTKERTKAVNDWMKKNRPDIKIKQVDFTDPSKVGQIAGDFLTGQSGREGTVRRVGSTGVGHTDIDAGAGREHSGHDSRSWP